ncbi:sugar ABC transporter substrate-binding protein [Marinococcus halotolerans]|uniref:sugar ABC transporter substrate-binding protein n=1 Tax=Marinococcus halotolerans TaxID=301092 RepID=UPI0003B63D3C|nr:extracellular solute-binding protein [Marinococcus halotolerans]
MKTNRLFLILFTAIFVVAGCAPERSQNSASEDQEEEASKPEELTIWANDEEKHLEAVQEIAADFEEREDITINVQAKPVLDQLQELSLAGPEGKGPDLFLQPHDQIGNIVSQGLATPLDLSDEEISGYSNTALDSVSYNFENENNYYAVPSNVETQGVFYNKEIVSEEPKNIDDLKTILENNTDASKDKFGFLMKPNDLYFAYPFLKNYGGYIFEEENGEFNTDNIGLNNEGSVEGAELFQTFFGEGLISTSTTSDVIDGLFTSGNVGAVINGPWSIENYQESLGEDLGFTSFPEINNEPGTTLVGTKGWFVSYYSEKKEWAKELALFITNEENQKRYFEIAGELPANVNALESIEDPIYSEFAKQVEYGTPMPNTPQTSQVWEPMNNALQFIAEGEKVKPTLDEAVNQIETNIEASGAQ